MASGASGGLDTLRVVLLGKTGAGKSSLGNALANIKDKGKKFKVGRGLRSETKKCAWKKGIRNGLAVEVTDTPGLCDTHLPAREIYKEVGKSVAVAEPGPHVLLFTLRCDRRFTEEEYGAYKTIKEMFSTEMNRFMILVFNGLDTYDDAETIEDQRSELGKEIEKFGNELNTMLREADGRYFGMNNKASPAEKEKQIRDLISMMLSLVERNGHQYYTTPVTTEIKKKVDDLIDERVSEKHISQDQAADEVKRDIVAERVQPGFFESVGGLISSFAGAVADACSVM